MDPFDPEIFLPVLFVAAHILTATGVWLCRRRRNTGSAVCLYGNGHFFLSHSSCVSLTVYGRVYCSFLFELLLFLLH